MANWSVLKTAVANIINTNGNQAITGQLLQNVLNNIITNVGENSTFAGVATVDTNPGAPDGPVFYLATTAGIYPNFNSLEVLEGEAVIFEWDNGAWSKKATGFATQEKLTNLQKETDEKLSQLASKVSVFVENNGLKLDDVISDGYTKRQIYASVISTRFYNCNSEDKRSIYVLWNGYGSNFDIRVSKLNQELKTWEVEFHYTKPISEVNPSYNSIIEVEAVNGKKKVVMLIDTAIIKDLKSAYILNNLTDEPDMIFSDVCYENPLIGETKDKVETLEGGEIETEINKGYVNANGIVVSGGSSYKYTSFIAVDEFDEIEFGISGSDSTLGYSEYSDNIDSAIVLDTAVKNNNNYRRLSKKIGAGIRYIRICFNDTIDGDYSIKSKGKVGRIENRIDNLEDTIFESEIETDWTLGFISKDGTENILKSGNYKMTGYIQVDENELLKVGISGSSSTCGVSFYSEKKQDSILHDYSIINDGTFRRLDVNIPNGVRYIRLVLNDTYDGNYTVIRLPKVDSLQSQVDKLKSVVRYDNYPQYLFQHGFISPKKACISFQMDCNTYVINGGCEDFAKKLDAIGTKATFFPLPNSFTNSKYLELMQKLQKQGHEVSIHTVPSDGIGTNISPHPSNEEFAEIVNEYVSDFVSNGMFPIGWVTSQGKMVEEYLPLLNKYVGYAHTLGNGAPSIHTPSNYVNTSETDRYKILRWGIEQHHDDSDGLTDNDVISKAKQAIDYAISIQGHVHLYCHSYNLYNGTSYTLRESVFDEILAYVKEKVNEGKLIVGTTAEVCNYYYNR